MQVGKTVRPEFGVKFEPVFRKILELRAWYIQDEPCDFIFPLRNEIQQLGPVSNCKITINKKVFYSAFSLKWFGLLRNSGVSIKVVNMLS